MKKKYIYIFLLFLITGFSAQAQAVKNNPKETKEAVKKENTLEKVQIYPNPVSNGKIYVNAETNTPKQIELYDMLGKRVLGIEMSSYQKEINVSSLKAGVYILKINDASNSITRKIIIK